MTDCGPPAAQDPAVEAWLRRSVAPAYDAVLADPADVMTSADVRAHLAARRRL